MFSQAIIGPHFFDDDNSNTFRMRVMLTTQNGLGLRDIS